MKEDLMDRLSGSFVEDKRPVGPFFLLADVITKAEVFNIKDLKGEYPLCVRTDGIMYEVASIDKTFESLLPLLHVKGRHLYYVDEDNVTEVDAEYMMREVT